MVILTEKFVKILKIFNFYATINIRYPIVASMNFKRLKSYYKTTKDKDILEAINILSKNNKLMIPFNINFDIKNDITLEYDIDGYPYIYYLKHKVFFPLNYEYQDILGSLNTHLLEQHNDSPHQYYVDCNKIGHTAILIGASDGFFAIDIINNFNKIYLIESDIMWIEPLSRTFKSYNNKISIINKYVSDITVNDTIKLDDLFATYRYSIDYLQADVEGAAINLLNGAKNILEIFKPTLSIACYHNHDEAENLQNFISLYYKHYFFSNRFVYMWMNKLKPPFFRKGIINALNS